MRFLELAPRCIVLVILFVSISIAVMIGISIAVMIGIFIFSPHDENDGIRAHEWLKNARAQDIFSSFFIKLLFVHTKNKKYPSKLSEKKTALYFAYVFGSSDQQRIGWQPSPVWWMVLVILMPQPLKFTTLNKASIIYTMVWIRLNRLAGLHRPARQGDDD